MRGRDDQPYVPSSVKTWIDPLGRSWNRRGEGRDPAGNKLVRSAIRREDGLVASWWAGDINFLQTPEERQAFIELCGDLWPDQVRATQWRAATGDERLLLLEVDC